MLIRDIVPFDDKTANEFRLKLAKIIDDEGYTPDQVWNADETVLFWNKMPSRTDIEKSQTTGGIDILEDRFNFIFCCNASGDHILKPLLINRSLSPWSLKDVDLSELPVYWMTSKTFWVSKEIFEDWFNCCFIPEVKKYLKKKILNSKFCL